jgi:chlorobactene glucosyltransferase
MMLFGLSALELVLILYAVAMTLVMAGSVALFVGFPRLPPDKGQGPLVSVILPVRNQRATVEACLRSLLQQQYPRREIIVVDGGSEDGTREVLEGYSDRAKVLDEPPLPDGWVGKNWACHQGFQAARGELLLFTDGDTLHHPTLLGRAVAYLEEEGLDLLTLSPRIRVESFWEKVLMPFMIFLIALTYRGAWVNRQDKPWAVGNGQFLLFRRSVYEALGGHDAVRDRVDEDYRLARLAKSRGYRIRMADARDLMEVRMYSSLREIWLGWSKNVFPGLDFRLTKVARGVINLFSGFVLPFVLLAAGVVQLVVEGPSLLLVVGSLVSSLVWARVALAYSFLSGSARFALLTPLAALIISVILVDSARRYLRAGGVPWKGRLYGMPQRES